MATDVENTPACSACSETFGALTYLLCQHALCKACVSQRIDSDVIQCPECNAMTHSMAINLQLDCGQRNEESLSTQRDTDGNSHCGGSEFDDVIMTSRSKCDLCDDGNIAHWCSSCQLSLCQRCSSKHSEQHVPGRHDVTAAAAKQKSPSSVVTQQTPAKMALRDVVNKTWTKQQEQLLPSFPQALRVINGQLWCCCSNKVQGDFCGVVAYNGELQLQQTIECRDVGDVYDVAVIGNGDIVMATAKGLQHTSQTGKWFCLLSSTRK